MFYKVVYLCLIACVFGQDYYEERHKYQYRGQMAPFNKIPSKFEVKGDNTIADFNKYLMGIHELAKRDNLTVIYKVQVEIDSKQKFRKKSKKGISKKFNIPLKKQNMKLSNFEVILRKRMGEMGKQQQRVESDVPTTEKQKVLLTTKPPWAGKYKPIIGSVRTNYTKIVRPVRNNVITLTF